MSTSNFHLEQLPAEIIVDTLINLSPSDMACVHATCLVFHGSMKKSARPGNSLTEQALLRRAMRMGYGHAIPMTLPCFEVSWFQKLCWDERRRDCMLRRQNGNTSISSGSFHSAFISADGQLYTCGLAYDANGQPMDGLLGHGDGVLTVEHMKECEMFAGMTFRSVHGIGASPTPYAAFHLDSPLCEPALYTSPEHLKLTGPRVVGFEWEAPHACTCERWASLLVRR